MQQMRKSQEPINLCCKQMLSALGQLLQLVLNPTRLHDVGPFGNILILRLLDKGKTVVGEDFESGEQLFFCLGVRAQVLEFFGKAIEAIDKLVQFLLLDILPSQMIHKSLLHLINSRVYNIMLNPGLFEHLGRVLNVVLLQS